MKHKVPTALIILDGFGYRKERNYNAIAHAHTPHIKRWLEYSPHTFLQASGTTVGLPPGYIGNSQVGHLTIGAGRIIKQPVTIINEAIQNKTFFSHPVLLKKLAYLKTIGARLHLMGLLSDAGIHSHEEHLYAFLKVAAMHNIDTVIVHPFLDGRDTPPQSAAIYLQRLENHLKEIKNGIIGSLHGRFYAMDRDRNWERTAKSYTVLTQPIATKTIVWQDVIGQQYAEGITDEFIIPTQLTPLGHIQPHDGIIFFNIRPDRARQLTSFFYNATPLFMPLVPFSFFITPVPFAKNLPTDALWKQEPVHPTLNEVINKAGKTIFTIAETEKYAHVTYFFNGGNEQILSHETRILIPSLPKKNYIEYPEMSAPLITQTIINSLQNNVHDFYLVNYANADMVAHSGDFDATVKAIECLDHQLYILYNYIVVMLHGTMYITADHGNAEDMYNPEMRQPRTAHTCNPVPFIMLSGNLEQKNNTLPLTQLADIAPFILQHMHLKIPEAMKK